MELEERVDQRTADLRESERFRRAVLDALPAKIAVLEARGVVMAVNERWKELEIGSNYLDFCRQAAASGEASAIEAAAILESVLKGERTEGSVEYPCHTATEQQWFMMQVIHASEQVGGAIVSHVDITARMKAEESVRQSAEELKRSNRDLEQFAYIAGHDLQEPLRMVTGLMGLLRDGYKGKQLDAKADQYIDFAVDGAHRMSMMIKDLLEYSRTGTKGLKLAPADIADIVSAVQANLRRIIEETKAVITHDPLPTVTADASQMMQVFQNLIENAIKFRKPDRPCQVHVGAAKKDGQWMFSVRDNGIGIDPKQADRVFLLFQRLHTRDKYPGSGIGLAICKKIVERHGGRIWVESAMGGGSTFFFTIPHSL
jgi:light-regulated signal transduction histidine kinase (bacteriophytochrome)